ncbi:hypothetical protein V8E53_015607 [Lactarius tabidus]
MASTHAAATSAVLAEESGPQAGPLPSKRGEIGFIEGVHTQPPPSDQPVDQDTLPARHPADRPPQLPSSDEAEAPLPSGSSPVSSDSSSTNTVDKYPCLWRNKLPEFMGIHSMTFLLIFIQLSLFAGTIVGWIFAAMALGGQLNAPPPPGPPGAQNLPPPDHTSNIFVNVAFAVIVIAQLIFLERRVYRVRAERYAFKHPGETLRGSLRRSHSLADATIPVAPWNRPPLPTYAATLAASGVGTGDVEDPEIAPAPPPAYGKTRGSTLILAGFLRDSLLIRVREHEENRSESRMSDRSDRPVSLRSREEEGDGRRSADLAHRTDGSGRATST